MRLHLHRHDFTASPRRLLEGAGLTVDLFRYPSGVEALRVSNTRGTMTLLPYQGQMIWDLQFDGVDLTMHSMFDQPRPAQVITDTYGCFAFHAGLLRNGCPAPEDTHQLHGELPCADMDACWLQLSDGAVEVHSSWEYVQGFGDHYRALPSVRLGADDTHIRIAMSVQNLSRHRDMPLQYMCHLNYAFVDKGRFEQTVPEDQIRLRETVPAHVTPTLAWEQFNDQLRSGAASTQTLDQPERYDPEIVYFADDLPRFGDRMRFELQRPDGGGFFTEFDSGEFPYATRWILHNPDQQVSAFALPATCRPEGFSAAQRSGTLQHLRPGQQRDFHVVTGLS